jgi:ferredoxin
VRPIVDEDVCTGCELCADTCPEVFRIMDDGLSHVIVEEPGPDLWDCAREAEEVCPVGAITIEG